ncbi:hypothetical protein G6F22_020022 [Rhizopus arrhizus]|nr:hypothetical protein G6F22_020022 [Rhizopus arrhizus]
MKLEQISLRTGFLLALAGWAAAVWLATGFGLGSQLPGADGDADAAPQLQRDRRTPAVRRRPQAAALPARWQRASRQRGPAPDRRADDRQFQHGHLHYRTEPLGAAAPQR